MKKVREALIQEAKEYCKVDDIKVMLDIIKDNKKVLLERDQEGIEALTEAYEAIIGMAGCVERLVAALKELDQIQERLESDRLLGLTDALVDIIERKFACVKKEVETDSSQYMDGVFDAYDCIVDTTEFEAVKAAINTISNQLKGE